MSKQITERKSALPVSHWPSGGAGMAARIRSFNWARTPLGPIQNWSRSLKDAVEFMLTSRLPSCILWRPNWTLLHNDAAAGILAGVNPDALGRPVFEAAPASRAECEAVLRRVAFGESVRLSEMRWLIVDGETPRELWMEGQACPLADENGAPAGALVVFADVTAYVKARRERDAVEAEIFRNRARDAYLLMLSDALRPLADAAEIKRKAARVLGERLGATRATYFEVGESDYIVEEDYADGVPSLCGAYPIKSFGCAVFETLRRGSAAVQSDVPGDPHLSPTEKACYAAIQVAAYIAVPLLKEGTFIGGVAIQSARAREWSKGEVALVQETGERTWAAVERARAEAALSQNEERLRLAQQIGRVGVFDWNVETNAVIWTPETEDLFGVSRGEFENSYEGWRTRVHPDDLSRLETLFAAWLGSGRAEEQWEYRSLRQGEVRWMSARGRMFRDRSGKPLRVIGACLDVTERNRTEDALRESLDRLAAALRAGKLGVYDYDPRTGRIKWDRETYHLQGVPEGEPVTYETFEAGVHPEDLDAVKAALRRALEPSGPGRYECEYRAVSRGDKSVRWIFADGDATFEGGQPVRLVGTVQDITERKRAQERIDLLLREVNHRTKNMLSIVQAIAHQTVASSADDFIDRFEERLRALTASQDLLIKSAWRGVSLAELVESQLDHFQDPIRSRIEFGGPVLLLSASAAQVLGMAIHELAANASEYGALSNCCGRVRIAWELEPGPGADADFVIKWREQGGPPVDSPRRRGFGTTIISHATETSLDGKVELGFETKGLTWRLRCPAGKVLERGHSLPSSPR